MFRFFLILIGLSLIVIKTTANALPIQIIANKNFNNLKISQQVLADIYTGRLTYINKINVNALDLTGDSTLRKEFLQKLLNITPFNFSVYCARMLFTGQKTSPKLFSDNKKMINYIQNNKNAIGYKYADSKLPANLAVILTIK